MISNEFILLCTAAYLALLFYVAYRGDQRPDVSGSRYQPLIYTLSLTVYCTSWTFFGAVGSAARDGWQFFSIYLGPILVFALFHPFLRKLVSVSKRQKTTTIADFIATRYGKSNRVAALVTLIALVGTLPYISLQIKAIAGAYDAITASDVMGAAGPGLFDTAFGLTLILSVFAILFGARTIDASVHHRGMLQAISVESVVKLIAFLLIAALSIQIVVELATAPHAPSARNITMAPFSTDQIDGAFWTKTLLAAAAIFLLPRQFHVLAVEARGDEMATARWGFPLYLALFSMAVLPITAAGVQMAEGRGDADLFVLFLPMVQDNLTLSILGYLGGFSAATGMVIVATIALSTMVSNDLIFPLLVRRGMGAGSRDLHARLLLIRRMTIIGIMLLAYGYYLVAGTGKSLYSIGLLSFAAAAQFVPAVVGGLYWKRGHRNGVLVGLLAGFSLWLYTLLLPSLASAAWLPSQFLNQGLFGIDWLKPDALFGLHFDDSLTHGVFWSLAANLLGFVLVSLKSRHSFTDRLQASAYVELIEPGVGPVQRELRVADLYELTSRFTGESRARQFFMEQGYDLARDRSQNVTPALATEVQHLLAGSIGTASAEHLLRSTLSEPQASTSDFYHLLDTAGQALKFNREVLQVTLDHIGQAVSVVDRDLRLQAWNRLYVDLFDYPVDYLYVGQSVDEVIRYNVERGFGPTFPGSTHEMIDKRLNFLKHGAPYAYVREWQDGRVIQTQGARLPNGGFITTFTDITALKQAERNLAATNENLEQKVEARTRMLSALNEQLAEATRSKSRFLAAASHDLTQPLGASKLYMGALLEDLGNDDKAQLARNALAALHTAEALLKSLLHISKLDSGAMQPEITRFPIQRLFDALENEFGVIARQKGLNLRIHKSQCGAESDITLLRSILQNFIANAIRYTDEGVILVTCRRAGPEAFRIEVRDSGRGIPADKLEDIFAEFRQLQRGGDGVGLGLAISQRTAALLNHPIKVRSREGQGSTFSVTVPRVRVQQVAADKVDVTPAASGWLAGTRVLCVDDDADILNATRSLLTRWGGEVTCVQHRSDFEAATDQGEEYEIVLMDYQLHDAINGLDLLQSYRAISPRPFVGVLVTAEQDGLLLRKTLDLGFQFLAKPVEPAKLRSILNTAILARRQARSEAAP